MAMVRWECPGYNETQPALCRDFLYPVPGTYTRDVALGYDPA